MSESKMYVNKSRRYEIGIENVLISEIAKNRIINTLVRRVERNFHFFGKTRPSSLDSMRFYQYSLLQNTRIFFYTEYGSDFRFFRP